MALWDTFQRLVILPSWENEFRGFVPSVRIIPRATVITLILEISLRKVTVIYGETCSLVESTVCWNFTWKYRARYFSRERVALLWICIGKSMYEIQKRDMTLKSRREREREGGQLFYIQKSMLTPYPEFEDGLSSHFLTGIICQSTRLIFSILLTHSTSYQSDISYKFHKLSFS